MAPQAMASPGGKINHIHPPPSPAELKKKLFKYGRELSRDHQWKHQVVGAVIDKGLTRRHHLRKVCIQHHAIWEARGNSCPERKSSHGSVSSLQVNQDQSATAQKIKEDKKLPRTQIWRILEIKAKVPTSSTRRFSAAPRGIWRTLGRILPCEILPDTSSVMDP